jgi:hypothetical protein
MGEQFFDDLARGLDEGTLSRRRPLKLAGGALVAVVLPSLFPREAEAVNRAKRRCRRKGGVYLTKGNCRCAITCPFTSDKFTCHSNPNCVCMQTLTGSGFCADNSSNLATGCSSNAGCPVGKECLFNPGCTGSGGSCTTEAQCKAINQFYACVNGTCQFTGCASPCPT